MEAIRIADSEAAWSRPRTQQQQQLRYSKKGEQRDQNVLLAAAPESYVHAIDLVIDRQDAMGPKRRS